MSRFPCQLFCVSHVIVPEVADFTTSFQKPTRFDRLIVGRCGPPRTNRLRPTKEITSSNLTSSLQKKTISLLFQFDTNEEKWRILNNVLEKHKHIFISLIFGSTRNNIIKQQMANYWKYCLDKPQETKRSVRFPDSRSLAINSQPLNAYLLLDDM